MHVCPGFTEESSMAQKQRNGGRYRSWLIMVPWMVPFLYAFMFIRVSDNEWVSAVVIIAASIASHVAWNFSYVANATLISIVGKTPEDKATLASPGQPGIT